MKIKQLIISVPFFFALSSCVDLEYNELGLRSEEWVYNSPLQGVQSLVASVYGYVPSSFGINEQGALLSSACDESDFVNQTSNIHKYYNGGWSPIIPFSYTWDNGYRAILEANMFLEKIDKVSLEEYKNNVAGTTDYELLRQKFALFPYEVRALRAYYYFELFKTYGDVPLVTKTLTAAEANTLTRDPYEEVIRFIVDECDAIIEHLPVDYSKELSKETGRTNRAFVLALRARTLLYAASPLFNPSNDKTKWELAAVANKEVIDSCAVWGIKLGTYQALWGHDNYYNKEILFIRGSGERNDFEINNYPVGVENARSGNCPTQTLVDAYEYKSTGKSFGETWGSAQTINLQNDKPFDDLDPRFSMTIVRQGDMWPSYNTNPIDVTQGGRNGAPLFNATTTGYYLKKFCSGSVNISTNNSSTNRHNWIIFRLGEFYLNYAEAMYNFTGNAEDKGEFGMSANDAINVLRDRSDVQMPHFSGNDGFEERYRRERMVELAFENHRFWDVRRWKIGEALSSVQTMNFENVEGNVVMERSVINRQWDDKHYFYPIPYTERYKNPNLEQNPGWF